MKTLVFDTSTVISLASTNLLWLIRPLKKQFKGKFIIPESVKKELVDRPINSKKFKLEAIMIKDLLMEGNLKLYSEPQINKRVDELLEITNKIYWSKNNPIKIIQKAELEVLVLAMHLKSEALVVDERTLRLLIEDPQTLKGILSSRLRTNITINKKYLSEFQKNLEKVKIIRSTELVYMAYKLKLLDKYITSKKVFHKELSKELLEGALWALKLNGCSISGTEINEILKYARL